MLAAADGLFSLDALSLHVVTLKGSGLGIEETAGQQGSFVKAFDKSGEWVALGASGGRVEIWNVKKALKVGELPAPKGSYRARNLIALELIDEKTLAGAYTNGVTAIWDIKKRVLLGKLSDFGGSRRYASLQHEGEILVSGSDLGVSVWNLSKRRLLWMFKYSSEGNFAYFASQASLTIFEGKNVTKRALRSGNVITNDVLFDKATPFANGTKMLVALENHTGFEVWQKLTRRRLAIFAPIGGVQTYQLDGERRLYALTKARRTLQILDLTTLRPLAQLNFDQTIERFRFFDTPTGNRMVTINDIYAVDLWNLDSGVRLGRLDVLNTSFFNKWGLESLGISLTQNGQILELNDNFFGIKSISAYNLEQKQRVWSFEAPELTKGQPYLQKFEGSKYLIQTRDTYVVIRDLSTGRDLAGTVVPDHYQSSWVNDFLSSGVLYSSEDWRRDAEFLVVKRGWSALIP